MSPRDDRRRTGRKTRVLDRVVALRRTPPAAPAAPAAAAPDDTAPDDTAPLAEPGSPTLQERLNALEAAFEALQDSVHREAERHDREITELHRQLQPSSIAQALSADARRRGLE